MAGEEVWHHVFRGEGGSPPSLRPSGRSISVRLGDLGLRVFLSISPFSSVRSTVAVSLASCLQYRASREVSGCCRKLPIHIRCRRLGFCRDMALSRSLQATPTYPSVSRESRTSMANRLSHPHLSSPSSR